MKGKGVEIVDFSMQDDRNFPSPYSEYFVPNISYNNDRSAQTRFQHAISFAHSSIAVERLEKLLQQEQPSIAHLHNIYHQLTPSIIPVLKRHGIKVALTLHDYKLVCPSYLALNGEEICTACNGRFFWKPLTTNCQGSRIKGLLLAVEAFFHKWRKSYEAVDLFISPSRFLADLTSYRIPQNKIRILHNGIDVAEYLPNLNDQGYGLYFGRISREKGIETLLKAHAAMATSVPLKVVGTGPLLEELHSKYTGAEFLGYKSSDELNCIIKNAAFVVVPSKWYENCAMAILEAMVFGKPVIGSRIGGIPEQIQDNKTGFLFEMGNSEELAEKMKILACDPEMRTRMGHAARKKLEKEYSLASHCKGLMDICNELLQ